MNEVDCAISECPLTTQSGRSEFAKLIFINWEGIKNYYIINFRGYLMIKWFLRIDKKVILSIFFLLTTINSPSILAKEQIAKTGSFEILSSSGQLLDAETAAGFSELLETNEQITWKVYVPETYDPLKPVGLLVYFNNRDQSYISENWEQLFENENLIWVSPMIDHRSFKAVEHGKWSLMGVLASLHIQQEYNIDTNRVFVAGHGIGGVTASQAVVQYASIYKGGIIISCGPDVWDRQPPVQVEQMKNSRYYFLSGDEGFAKSKMYRVVKKYKSDGITNAYHDEASKFDPDRRISASLFKQALHYIEAK